MISKKWLPVLAKSWKGKTRVFRANGKRDLSAYSIVLFFSISPCNRSYNKDNKWKLKKFEVVFLKVKFQPRIL